MFLTCQTISSMPRATGRSPTTLAQATCSMVINLIIMNVISNIIFFRSIIIFPSIIIFICINIVIIMTWSGSTMK